MESAAERANNKMEDGATNCQLPEEDFFRHNDRSDSGDATEHLLHRWPIKNLETSRLGEAPRFECSPERGLAAAVVVVAAAACLATAAASCLASSAASCLATTAATRLATLMTMVAAAAAASLCSGRHQSQADDDQTDLGE